MADARRLTRRQLHDAPPAPSWKRWWRRSTAFVLAAGALAGAVSAVLGLWPDPEVDAADRAVFGQVSVRVPFPLSEYRARTQLSGVALPVRPLPDAVRVAAQGTPDPQPDPQSDDQSDDQPDPADEATPGTDAGQTGGTSGAGTQTATGQASTTPATGGTGGGTTETTTPDPGSPQEQARLLREVRDVMAHVRRQARGYRFPTPPPGAVNHPLVKAVGDATDAEGEPLPPAEAAERVVGLFRDTRTIRLQDGRKEPVGALLSINVELQGLRDETVLLTWEIFQSQGGAELLGEWLGDTPAYRLTPRTEHDSASFRVWVPMPKAEGPYTVALTLVRADGASLAVVDTGPFS